MNPWYAALLARPFDDIQSLETIADNNPNICALFVEPIQGEGGIRVAADDYLQTASRILHRERLAANAR